MDKKIENVLKDSIKEYLLKNNVNVNKVNMNSDKINFDKNDTEDILEKFIKIKKKYFIVNRKYNVIYSEAIKKEAWSFTKNQQLVLKEIEDKIINGENIKPYLSNSLYLFKMSKKDELKDNYNIYHMHLGHPDKKEHFVTRTGKLLFFTYDENNVYFLDVRKHPIGDEWNMSNAIKIKEEMNISSDKKIDDVVFKNKDMILNELNNIDINLDEKEIKNIIMKLL